MPCSLAFWSTRFAWHSSRRLVGDRKRQIHLQRRKRVGIERGPVDALQYEKLALSAFDLCDRQVGQLDTLITLASSIVRIPAITSHERKRRQTLLELLVDTAEQYQQELECDRELFQVIALDAKSIPRSRITAQHATKLLAEASQRAKARIDEANASPRKKPSAKCAMTLIPIAAQQPVTAPHQAIKSDSRQHK